MSVPRRSTALQLLRAASIILFLCLFMMRNQLAMAKPAHSISKRQSGGCGSILGCMGVVGRLIAGR